MQDQWIHEALEFSAQTPHHSAKVVVIGDLGLDSFVMGSVDRISPEAPVPILFIEKSFDKPGCAANVGQNLVPLLNAWNLHLSMVGVVGRDEPAQALKRAFENVKDRVECLFVEDTMRPTTQKTRFMAGSQHQLLRVDSESKGLLTEPVYQQVRNKVALALEGATVVVLQDYAKGFFSRELFQEIFKITREKKILTLVDPNRNTPSEWYQGADIVKPNIREAEKMLGYSLEKGADNELVLKAAKDLKKRLGLKAVILTRSGFGLTYLNAENEGIHYPALARSVYDITGAGDTVVAILAAAYAAGARLEVACVLAMAASSCVVAKVGTANVEVDELVAELTHYQTSTQ